MHLRKSLLIVSIILVISGILYSPVNAIRSNQTEKSALSEDREPDFSERNSLHLHPKVQSTLPQEWQLSLPEPLTTRLISQPAQPPETRPQASGWITATYETFEGAFPAGSWIVFDNDVVPTNYGEYYWGVDDTLPKDGAASVWPARSGADGLDPEFNDYPDDANSWMIYGPVDLSNASDAEVVFDYNNISENSFDFFGWYASTDGSNFYGYRVDGDSWGWVTQNFDLTAVPTLGDTTGNSTVWVAFVFTSDGSITERGPYVDNVAFRAYLDTVPPTVSSILRSDANPTHAANIHFDVTFSEDVTGVDTGDFELALSGVSGAAISGISGISSTYTVTVSTGTGDGTLRLDVTDNDSILNAALQPLGGAGMGNGDYTSGQSYTIDKTHPSVSSILRLDANPVNAASVRYLVSFSEAVTGLDSSDLVLTTTGGISGESVLGMIGSGGVYTVTVSTGTGDGTLRLDVVDDDTILDLAGNPLGGAGTGNGDFTGGETYTIDKFPLVSAILRTGPSPTNATSVGFKITFSENVTGVDAGDFSLATSGISGAGITSITSGSNIYTVTVNTGTGDGTLQLDVTDDDTIVNGSAKPLGGAGPGNGDFTSGETYTLEKTPPVVSSITRLNNSPTNAAYVGYQVTFSEPVTGVDAGDFELTLSGVSGAGISNISGAGNTYTVIVDSGSGDGTLRLDVSDDDTISDSVGNRLGGAGAGNGDYTGGETYTLDRSLSTWSSNGPFGGYLNSLVIAPSNPDVLYAGTDFGLYKTTSNGVLWAKTNFTDTLVQSAQVSPMNPDVVYVGTENGVFKSEDGGDTWTPKGLADARINALAIDPSSPSTVYAGTGWPLEMSDEEIVGVFRSTNGGDTWSQVLSGDLDAVAALLIDTDNPAYVYVGVYTEGNYYGFYKSANGGDSWAGREVSGYNWDEVTALAMTPAGTNPRTIYAVGNDDVFMSTDRGETWSATGTPWISPSGPWSVAVDPNMTTTVYVSTRYFEGFFYKSTDSGANWSIKASGFPAESAANIVIDPRNSHIFTGLDSGGVYYSNDGAETWQPYHQGLLNTTITGLAGDPNASETVVAAINGEGHHPASTANAGILWNPLSSATTDVGGVGMDPQNPATLYVGRGYARTNGFLSARKSIDSGNSWSIHSIFNAAGSYVGVSDFWIHPITSTTVLVAVEGFGENGGGIYKSTDGGNVWFKKYSFWATTIAADPIHPNIVYFGTAKNGYVYQSTNSGSNWTMISPGGTWVWEVRDIEVDSSGNVYAATNDGLRKWNGITWSQLSGLPTVDVTAIAIDRTTTPEVIYIGTNGAGVYFSDDGGSTWTDFNEDLGNLWITKLFLGSSEPKTLYAGTNFGGVWSRLIAAPTYTVYVPLVLK